MADGDINIGTVEKMLKIGGTEIKICVDDCRDRSAEEVSALINQIAQQAVLSLAGWSKPSDHPIK